MLTNLTGLAEAALGEGGSVKLHKLSVKELKDVRRLLLLSSLALTRPAASQLFGMGKRSDTNTNNGRRSQADSRGSSP